MTEAPSRAFAAACEAGAEIAVRGVNCGSEPAEERGRNSYAERKQQDGGIQSDDGLAGNFCLRDHGTAAFKPK